jgi:outer membrane protein OmpA-like peptidoglycan-associated protein
MRSGSLLTTIVLLLLFLGFSAWGARHWQLSFVCDNETIGWVCGKHGGLTNVADTGLKKIGAAPKTPEATEPSDSAGSGAGGDAGSNGKSVAHPFAWPVAEAPPSKWTNRRMAAADTSSSAKPDAAGVTTLTKTVAHPFAWPVAEAPPAKWTNRRTMAAGSGSEKKTTMADATEAHPFPWPVADKSIAWTNRRAQPEAEDTSRDVTEAHPFPWPVADAPVKWTNRRAAPKPEMRDVTEAHPFPWPVADAPVQWTNRRPAPKPEMRDVTEAHAFPWPVADAPVKWTNRRAAPEPEMRDVTEAHAFPWPVADAPVKWSNRRAATTSAPTQSASDCSAELNRVAAGGTILFQTGSAKIDSSSYETLDLLADVAKSCDSVNITVEGHTDDRGSASFNQKLSERRAASVAAYLQGAGLSESSVNAVGYGESRPKVDNSSRANRAKNRRIEFSAAGR